MSSVVPQQRGRSRNAGAVVPVPPGGAPEILDVTSYSGGINLLFDASGVTGTYTGFLFERSTDGSNFTFRVGFVSSSENQITDPNVMNGVTYYYRVAAFNGLESNHGDWSMVAGPIYHTWEP